MKERESSICPAGDVFVRAFLNELSGKDRIRLLDHALHCPRCRLRFRALAGIRHRIATSPDLADPHQARLTGAGDVRWPLSRRFDGAARIAAALLVIVGIGAAGAALLSRHPSSPLLRGEGESSLRLVAPNGSLHVSPSRFEWTPLRGADAYTLEIIGQDLTTVYQGSGTGTSLEIPASARSLFVSGDAYVWTVTAHADDNRTLASVSGSFRID